MARAAPPESKTIEIVKRIKDEYGLEAMAHFTCVGATVPELRATLDEMLSAGIDNVLALRGDPPAGQEEWRQDRGRPGVLARTRRADLRRLSVRDRRGLFSGDPHPRRQSRGRSGTPGREGRRRRGFPDHTAVLRQRPLLRLRRSRARRRHGGADHPRHHAHHPGRAGRADGQDCGPRSPTACAGAARARRGRRGGARLRRRLRHAAVCGAAGRGRAGHPLHHAQPLARHARDPLGAEALASRGSGAL